MTDSFIPLELAVAPNPLGLTSNLKLTTIPVDAYTCYELWMPAPGEVLMAEEAILLMGDRSRLEEICAKVTHLLGATFVYHEGQPHHQAVSSWAEVQELIYQAGMKVDAIGASYLPQAIYPNLGNDESPTAWTLRPTTWNISFLRLHALAHGYRVEPLPISLSIALGQLITKYVEKVTATASNL